MNWYKNKCLLVACFAIFISCEKSSDNFSLEDLYQCEAKLTVVDYETWNVSEINEVLLLGVEFVSENEIQISKVANLNYGGYYFPDNGSNYQYDVTGDSIIPIQKIVNVGITKGVFLNDKRTFNFSHFSYKLGTPPGLGTPIWYPIEEHFYCEKNF